MQEVRRDMDPTCTSSWLVGLGVEREEGMKRERARERERGWGGREGGEGCISKNRRNGADPHQQLARGAGDGRTGRARERGGGSEKKSIRYMNMRGRGTQGEGNGRERGKG